MSVYRVRIIVVDVLQSPFSINMKHSPITIVYVEKAIGGAYMTEIKIDLKQDWVSMIEKEIVAEGLKIPEDMPIDNKIIKYFTYLRKKVLRGPLKVIKSKDFTCDEQYLPAVTEIERLFKVGGDISPYLSKWVDEFIDDLMFNDWGILHLHLGNRMEDNGRYIKRTGPLLFVYFFKDAVYFINVFPHKRWTNREVLQMMYNNWPELIERFVFPGVTDLEIEYTEKEHYLLRKNGVTTGIPLVNKHGEKIVIMGPGMGIASSGDSIKDVMTYQNIHNTLRRIELEIRDDFESLKEEIIKMNLTIPSILHFEFQGYNETEGLIVKENSTGLYLNFIY